MTTWNLVRWIWRLEAPLSIGMPPAGTLNRCRLYVPARTIHGAVTAELARINGDEKSKSPDYGKFGHEVGVNCRFTYLYPAEKIENKYLAWLPEYDAPDGLSWRRQGGNKNMADRKFRRCLLNTRPGTAITPESDSAAEGTLRETEYINPWWYSPFGNKEKPAPTLLLGYVFLRNNGFRRQLDDIDTLFICGDTRYGFGKIRCIECDDLSDNPTVFGQPVSLRKKDPEIKSKIVWGHVREGSQTPVEGMQGMKDLLGGWELKGPLGKDYPAWVPGSFLQGITAWWSVDRYGYWQPHPASDTTQTS